ncbi:Oidioi.mRNA.OKI2018_I69.chr1.g2694.t1.cds [Oikopleura dioica]|uniref:Oidioi.mRNA.OKI2018_I69.chr1.g2694.t1.cds n=1 Tax=Oikopleura dioica TaxID=34765 RepID=A0ABN7SRV3_OIKDI|nr:Oidioi.mRNA.OKI2018_I69.chr1.g2694.t1.cds [Oikopleura dioica]
MDFESIGDWDFMRGSDVRKIPSCSTPDSSVQDYSNAYFSEDENFVGSPSEKITDLIMKEFDYYTNCIRPEPIIQTVYQQPAQVFQIPIEEEAQTQTLIINQSSIIPIYAEPIQMITTVQNAFPVQETVVANSTTEKLKSQLIAKINEKQQNKTRSSPESPEVSSQKKEIKKETSVRAVKIQLKID